MNLDRAQKLEDFLKDVGNYPNKKNPVAGKEHRIVLTFMAFLLVEGLHLEKDKLEGVREIFCQSCSNHHLDHYECVGCQDRVYPGMRLSSTSKVNQEKKNLARFCPNCGTRHLDENDQTIIFKEEDK